MFVNYDMLIVQSEVDESIDNIKHSWLEFDLNVLSGNILLICAKEHDSK